MRCHTRSEHLLPQNLNKSLPRQRRISFRPIVAQYMGPHQLHRIRLQEEELAKILAGATDIGRSQ